MSDRCQKGRECPAKSHSLWSKVKKHERRNWVLTKAICLSVLAKPARVYLFLAILACSDMHTEKSFGLCSAGVVSTQPFIIVCHWVNRGLILCISPHKPLPAACSMTATARPTERTVAVTASSHFFESLSKSCYSLLHSWQTVRWRPTLGPASQEHPLLLTGETV